MKPHTLQRRGISRCAVHVMLLGCLLELLVVQSVQACSVPVFRYALERWPVSPYECIVISNGSIPDARHDLLKRFSGGNSNFVANISLQVVNSVKDVTNDFNQSASGFSDNDIPNVILRYPKEAGISNPVWSGQLTESNIAQILDSPVRRKIAQRLLLGDSAVWILLESGNSEPDNAAARMLETSINNYQQSSTTPVSETTKQNTVADSLIPSSTNTFTILRLARNDPAEEVFIRMLLESEDDLKDTAEPMAFPIYGRGRILYALVGNGINRETIDEACSFLTGPCSCSIKDQNPGIDLLMAVDWDHLVTPIMTAEMEMSELLGHSSRASLRLSDAESKGNSDDSEGAARIVKNKNVETRKSEPVVLKATLITLVGLGISVLGVGSLLLWRKRVP